MSDCLVRVLQGQILTHQNNINDFEGTMPGYTTQFSSMNDVNVKAQCLKKQVPVHAGSNKDVSNKDGAIKINI